MSAEHLPMFPDGTRANAEDCPACDLSVLPYPFICPSSGQLQEGPLDEWFAHASDKGGELRWTSVRMTTTTRPQCRTSPSLRRRGRRSTRADR